MLYPTVTPPHVWSPDAGCSQLPSFRAGFWGFCEEHGLGGSGRDADCSFMLWGSHHKVTCNYVPIVLHKLCRSLMETVKYNRISSVKYFGYFYGLAKMIKLLDVFPILWSKTLLVIYPLIICTTGITLLLYLFHQPSITGLLTPPWSRKSTSFLFPASVLSHQMAAAPSLIISDGAARLLSSFLWSLPKWREGRARRGQASSGADPQSPPCTWAPASLCAHGRRMLTAPCWQITSQMSLWRMPS